jgi:predicted glycosyltransferase
MNRESAILGTPTYTVFLGRLAAVDAELMRLGRLRDVREPHSVPRFEKKSAGMTTWTANAPSIMAVILAALEEVGTLAGRASKSSVKLLRG